MGNAVAVGAETLELEPLVLDEVACQFMAAELAQNIATKASRKCAMSQKNALHPDDIRCDLW